MSGTRLRHGRTTSGMEFASPKLRRCSKTSLERWITLGRNEAGRLLVVIYTWRGDNVRLISARDATAREKRQYEEPHEA